MRVPRFHGMDEMEAASETTRAMKGADVEVMKLWNNQRA